MQAAQQLFNDSFHNGTGQSSFSDSSFDPRVPRSTQLSAIDINETSLELLYEIDPTFWNLNNFLEATKNFPYYSELSFPQLVRSYAASLCVQTFQKNDHYYDKSLLFHVSYSEIQDLLYQSQVHLEQLKTTGSKIKSRKIDEVKDSLNKLGDLLAKLKNMPYSFPTSDYFLSRVWPNESSISNVVRFLPQYNDLFPLKRKEEGALQSLERLEGELATTFESNFGSAYGPTGNEASVYYLGQDFSSFINGVYKEVQTWYAGSSSLPTTPRKRSIDLVVDSEVQDGNVTSENTNPVLSISSPIVRKKSEIRKRRRFSIA